MDTVARVAQVAAEGCFQGSLNDKSGFHHVGLEPRHDLCLVCIGRVLIRCGPYHPLDGVIVHLFTILSAKQKRRTSGQNVSPL